MNEQQIRDALRGVAEATGRPDEAAAWERISGEIAREAAAAGRRRWLLGGAGLAIAGAAAALVLVLGTGDDHEAVEVGPAAESTTTATVDQVTTTSAPAPEVTSTTIDVDGTGAAPEVLADLPEHPLAVVVQLEPEGVQRLDLYDADTGELVVRGLAQSFFSIDEVSIEGDTVFYTEEFGDSSTVRMIPWDGSGGPTTPFDLDSEGTNGGTMSPDGSTFAFVEHGVTRPTARIGLVDTQTGSIRYIEYTSEEDQDALGSMRDLELSPDGTRLAFTKTYEGSGVYVLDIEATSLNDAVAVATGYHPAWLDDETILAIHFCCYPDFAEPQELEAADASGGGTEPFGATPVPADAISIDGGLVARVSDGSLVVTVGGVERDVLVNGRAVDVGL